MLKALRGLRDHFHAVQERRRELRDIAALDPRALDEIGLSRGQLRRIAETPAAVNARMLEMARRHSLDPAKLEACRQDYAELLDTCAHCRATAACAAYLAEPSHGPYAAGFCPNHKDYLALRHA